MTAIKTLQKRLDKLEVRPTTEPDIVEFVLPTVTDEDLELLQELSILRESGFDEEQIAEMMKDRYQDAQEAIAHFQDEYQVALRKESRAYGL